MSSHSVTLTRRGDTSHTNCHCRWFDLVFCGSRDLPGEKPGTRACFLGCSLSFTERSSFGPPDSKRSRPLRGWALVASPLLGTSPPGRTSTGRPGTPGCARWLPARPPGVRGHSSGARARSDRLLRTAARKIDLLERRRLHPAVGLAAASVSRQLPDPRVVLKRAVTGFSRG